MLQLLENIGLIRPMLSPEDRSFFQENGYLILKGFYSEAQIAKLNDQIAGIWAESRSKPSRIVVDIFTETPNQRRVKLNDAPIEAKGRPHKINDLFLEYPQVRDFVLSKRLGKILTDLLGHVPVICNTLNFEYGSQQDYHTDSLYMTPLKDLNLIATWTALEDCRPEAGPLMYYPGSHKIPPFLFSHGRMAAVHEEMGAYRDYMEREVHERGLDVAVGDE